VQMAFLVMGVGMGAACLAGLLDREFRNARIPETQAEVHTPSQAAIAGELAAEAG
jgi:hypothetical protein